MAEAKNPPADVGYSDIMASVRLNTFTCHIKNQTLPQFDCKWTTEEHVNVLVRLILLLSVRDQENQIMRSEMDLNQS